MQLDGASILVTGSSSGIGASLARQLAAEGATVGLVARRRERLEEVLADCREHTPGSRFWVADLGDLDRAEAVAQEAWEAFSGLDSLVNNAGMPKRWPIADLEPEVVEAVMRVNFFSPMRMGQAVLRPMLELGHGQIVNVSSTGGRIPIAHEAAYCAAKYALAGWSDTAALDLAHTPIEIKLILPGPIDTEIWDVPGNVETVYHGELVAPDDCAAGIVAAMRSEGYEYFVPPVFPGGIDAKELAVNKAQDAGAFVQLMADFAAASADR